MYRSKIELHNVDCLPFMKQCEDKQFDLAIVDPPYGLGIDGQKKAYLKTLNIIEKHTTLKIGIMQYRHKSILMSLNV